MTTFDKNAFRIRREKIREILNREWDPIGRCPPNEYDTYADRLNGMVYNHASDDELARYLDWAVSVNMGFGHSDPEHARRVVASIRAALGSKD